MRRIVFVAGLTLIPCAMSAQEKILSPKEAEAAILADLRGTAELHAAGRDVWSPFVTWSGLPSTEPIIPGSVSAATLSHKVPKAARETFDRGEKSLQKGDVATAAKEFEQAVVLDPGYAAAHGELGAAYARMNRLAEAEVHLLRATSLDAYVSVTHLNLAWVQFEMHKLLDAQQSASRALALSSTNDRARLLLGILLASDPTTRNDGVRHIELAARSIPGLAPLLEELRGKHE